MKAPQADCLRRQPLMDSLPLSKGDVCAADKGILMGFFIIDLNDLCTEPITISQPRGQLSSGKRAYCSGS
jgi:hypothetical protein